MPKHTHDSQQSATYAAGYQSQHSVGQLLMQCMSVCNLGMPATTMPAGGQQYSTQDATGSRSAHNLPKEQDVGGAPTARS
jgi:hypothetical protein